ncbi:regulatory-associated protein of TOR 1-like [Hibiscus syriacus]|uniref:regulatory-associated protein of TOR 1-like n=1 Tax=Hibiscus syriacus TaxID=106335 RepID=UPI0019222294|nr:regulatory-associated protein of TOR 1-like [Hibiscus syriacus]
MAAFVLAVIVDGHRRGQEACIEVGLIQVCLKHLHAFTLNEAQTEPLLLQWLCLCLGKLWEDFAEAQVIGPLTAIVRDGRVSTSSPLTTAGIMHGSPLSDDSSHHSDSGILNDCVSNGEVHTLRPKSLDNAMYSQCVLAICSLAKDPSPRVASLGRRVLSIIGIEQVTKSMKPAGNSACPGDYTTSSSTPSASGLARSSSWLDISGGHLPLTFRTPPVSPTTWQEFVEFAL